MFRKDDGRAVLELLLRCARQEDSVVLASVERVRVMLRLLWLRLSKVVYNVKVWVVDMDEMMRSG